MGIDKWVSHCAALRLGTLGMVWYGVLDARGFVSCFGVGKRGNLFSVGMGREGGIWRDESRGWEFWSWMGSERLDLEGWVQLGYLVFQLRSVDGFIFVIGFGF